MMSCGGIRLSVSGRVMAKHEFRHPLSEIREALSLTQVALADELETSQGNVSDIERGVRACSGPLALRNASRFRMLLKALQLTVEEIMLGRRL